MRPKGRWHGLRALLHDGIEHGSVAVQTVHQTVASRPFDILETIPAIAAPTRVVRHVHDATVITVYASIRASNHALRWILDVSTAGSASSEQAQAEQ
ncbi:MAG: hypothetical protein R3B13_37885 [Polyangiaceae bacterium]